MKKTFTKLYREDGQQYKITAEVRFDDECKNGHKTFSITGEILRNGRSGTRRTRAKLLVIERRMSATTAARRKSFTVPTGFRWCVN